MKSSIQSVSTHPVATPDSAPMHHGMPPSATIWSDSVVRSSNVCGAGVRREQARLREVDHVGRVAALEPDVDLGLHLIGARPGDLDPGALHQRPVGLDVVGFDVRVVLVVPGRRQDLDRLTGVLLLTRDLTVHQALACGGWLLGSRFLGGWLLCRWLLSCRLGRIVVVVATAGCRDERQGCDRDDGLRPLSLHCCLPLPPSPAESVS
jgi:hypothetical protein